MQLEVWRKDSERLLHENNALHVQLIKQAERFDEDAKSGYIQRKRLEDQISELAFWKAQHVERYTVLEQENAALRERIHEVLRTGERVTGGAPPPLPHQYATYFRSHTSCIG
jgi:regulator of replication initiation timing